MAALVQAQASPITPATDSVSNGLLSRMPRDVQQRLTAQSVRVPIAKGDVLCEAGTPVKWAYLPCSGLVSLQTMTEDADSVELAMIGREGLIAPMFAAAESVHTAAVVMPGEAWRLKTEALQAELERNAVLNRVLLQYWQTLAADIAQGSVCHRFHTARHRLARWLLTASDRARTARIELTQERLGEALGLQRTGVTAASVALQDGGAIKARHGRITIIDRRRLESLACECYRAISSRTR